MDAGPTDMRSVVDVVRYLRVLASIDMVSTHEDLKWMFRSGMWGPLYIFVVARVEIEGSV